MKPPKPSSKFTPCPEEVAYIEMLRTTDMLSRGLTPILKAEDLSSNQYNVLRILRGSPDGLTCGEIGNRMITRDPDITRMLDRLEKRGLIVRWREAEDRRVVNARIAPAGLKLLERLDQPIRAAHQSQLGHLGAKRLKEIVLLMRESRARLE